MPLTPEAGDDQFRLRRALTPWAHAHGITTRQFDLVVDLCAGLPDKLIADRLAISVRTVPSELKTLYRRLGVNSRGELVAQCLHSLLYRQEIELERP